MKFVVFFCVAALLPALLPCAPVQADVVVMRNGDRLTGKMVAKEKNLLKFKTGYAGVLRIEWDQVRELRTDEDVLTILDDGSEHRTQVVAVDDEKVTIAPSEGGAPLSVEKARFAAIRRAPRESERWGGEFSGLVSLSMKSERGNTDSDDIGVDFDLTYRRNIHRARVVGELDKDGRDGEDTRENWQLGFSYSHFVTDRLYFTGWLKFEQDEFADLDLRTSVGPYVGFQFFESLPFNLKAEVGVILVREDFIMGPDNDYWGPGWHLLFNKYVLSDFLQVYHEQFGLINTEDADKWLWKSQTGLRAPLFGGLIGSAEAKFDYNSDPSEDIGDTQATYRLKLGYKW